MIRKLRGLLGLAVAAAGGCATAGRGFVQPVLRTDGVYWTIRRETPERRDTKDVARGYLRFYREGTVIFVPSIGSPCDLRGWFSAGSPHILQGRYRLERESLRFSVESSSGRVDFEGTASGDSLRLRSTSHINGNVDDASYSFTRWGPDPDSCASSASSSPE
jgi:hypothetical protein